jgi:hypothetical protein
VITVRHIVATEPAGIDSSPVAVAAEDGGCARGSSGVSLEQVTRDPENGGQSRESKAVEEMAGDEYIQERAGPHPALSSRLTTLGPTLWPRREVDASR